MKRSIVVAFLLQYLLPATGIAITADFSFTKACLGLPTTLTSTSKPADSIFKVLWDLDGDGRFNDAIGDTVKNTYPNPGFYYVGVKVIAFSGASDAVYKMVPVAQVDAAYSVDLSCLNLPVHFFNESVVVADTVFQYIWNFGDGTPTSFLRNPTHNYASAGLYTVKLTVISLSGCIDSVKTTLEIKDSPLVEISFSGDTIFDIGDSVIVTIVGIYDSVFWSTSATTNSIVISTAGYYYVQGYRNGCYGERYFTITVIEDNSVRIMSIITPNGDGFNDQWEILNMEQVAPCQADVYDRWGEKVLSSSQYNNDWEGTFNGKALPNDTYYYFVRCGDGGLRKGSLNIVK
ncbi:MAG: PKD domain-containing protein [bacterium]